MKLARSARMASAVCSAAARDRCSPRLRRCRTSSTKSWRIAGNSSRPDISGAISPEFADSDVCSEDESADDVRWVTRPGLRPGVGGMLGFPGSIRTATPSLNLTNDRSHSTLSFALSETCGIFAGSSSLVKVKFDDNSEISSNSGYDACSQNSNAAGRFDDNG